MVPIYINYIGLFTCIYGQFVYMVHFYLRRSHAGQWVMFGLLLLGRSSEKEHLEAKETC